MHATGFLSWPPVPEEAPNLDDVVETLRDWLERGTEAYRQSEDTYRRTEQEAWDSLDRLRERLEGDDLELLLLYEARSNWLSGLWGEDRFRIGFALGASTGRLFTS